MDLTKEVLCDKRDNCLLCCMCHDSDDDREISAMCDLHCFQGCIWRWDQSEEVEMRNNQLLEGSSQASPARRKCPMSFRSIKRDESEGKWAGRDV